MELLDCQVAFSYCSGDKIGRYHYELVAKYTAETGFAYIKLNLSFQPFSPQFHLRFYELNADGAWVDDNGNIRYPINPLPEQLKRRKWKAIRHVIDNYETLGVCYSRKTGLPIKNKHIHVGIGQFFITEIEKVRSIDFTTFKDDFSEVITIAKDGIMLY